MNQDEAARPYKSNRNSTSNYSFSSSSSYKYGYQQRNDNYGKRYYDNNNDHYDDTTNNNTRKRRWEDEAGNRTRPHEPMEPADPVEYIERRREIMKERNTKFSHNQDGKNKEIERGGREREREREREEGDQWEYARNLSKKKLWTGGLPPSVTAGELKSYFEAYGTVAAVIVSLLSSPFSFQYCFIVVYFY